MRFRVREESSETFVHVISGDEATQILHPVVCRIGMLTRSANHFTQDWRNPMCRSTKLKSTYMLMLFSCTLCVRSLSSANEPLVSRELVGQLSALLSSNTTCITSVGLITNGQENGKSHSGPVNSPTKATREDLEKHLREIGRMKGGGNPDADLVGFIENLDIVVGANVEAVVDSHSLAAAGISLENIALPMETDLTHASIRASLRLILDRSDLGFFVDDENRIVITTSRIARICATALAFSLHLTTWCQWS